MNKVILIGRLGGDPESRSTNSGLTVANFSLATSERKKERDQWVDGTEWHRISLFGKTAEIAAEHLRKGSQVAIEGRIQTRKWQDKEGNDRYATEIIGDRLHFVGTKGERKAEEAPKQDEPFEDRIPF